MVPFCPLQGCRNRFVREEDLLSYALDFGGIASSLSFKALMRETRLRRPYDSTARPGRLTLRDLATLVLRRSTAAYEAVCSAPTDDAARSVLYILQHSEPCPGCGVPVQRDGDCAGCPNVTCPVCCSTFRCACVVRDCGALERALTLHEKFQLHRLLCEAARVAEAFDLDRRELATCVGEKDLEVFSEAFAALSAEGGQGFSFDDLRVALADLTAHQLGELELAMLWNRLSPLQPSGRASDQVYFSEFLRQIKWSATPPL